MTNQLTQEKLIGRLRKTASEIIAEGHLGWGNVCNDAADAFAQLIQQPTSQESRQVEQGGDELVEACQELISQYEAVPEFTMGGKLTNGPFIKIREALANRRGGE